MSHWFDLTEARQDGRRGRLAEASSVVPPLVWLVLVLGGIVVVGYTCLFAMRVGLLTRFWGSLGIAVGVAALLLIPQFTMIFLTL